MLKRQPERLLDDTLVTSAADTSVSPGADVAELRPIEAFRGCPACLVVNGSDDVFCTACGAELPQPESATSHTTIEDSSVEEAEGATEETRARFAVRSPIPAQPEAPMLRSGPTRLRRPQWLALVVMLLLIVVAVAFTVLWRVEVGHSHRLAGRLATATGDLASARKQLAATEAQLKATNAVSQQRRAVLLRAQVVLGGVDPLLSSVDDLQKRTSDIQGGRDVFSSDADTLISDLITLGNYLIRTDPSYIDSSYEQQLIDTVNVDLSTVRADQASLGGYDASYGAASTRFGRHADSFTQAVRNLQHQLQAVASK